MCGDEGTAQAIPSMEGVTNAVQRMDCGINRAAVLCIEKTVSELMDMTCQGGASSKGGLGWAGRLLRFYEQSD